MRLSRGVTQQELSAMLGLEGSSVGKYEGRHNIMPSPTTTVKIANVFNVSIDYLFGMTDDPTPPKKLSDADKSYIALDFSEDVMKALSTLSKLSNDNKHAAQKYLDFLLASEE